MKNKLIFPIGLSLIPGIGPITARKLISYCGDAEAVFREKRNNLKKIPSVGPVLAQEIARQSVLIRAEQEILFMNKNGIKATSFHDVNYPLRLKNCVDAPIVLYSKGNFNWNASKIISIVGTRNASSYGRNICESLVQDLAAYNVLTVSGLAYGIDAMAHKFSLENNLKTVGVLAHGLEKIYPSAHTNLANSMLEQGGLITEFISNTKVGKENFVRRNRIVAGISDATIVVESKRKGGAMITARLANDYNRDVFAIPGRCNDDISVGCNHLIKTNQAHLCQSVQDVAYLLNWDKQAFIKQASLFELTSQEQIIVNLLKKGSNLHIDQIFKLCSFSYSDLAALLTDLELKNIIDSKPGKFFCLK